MDNFLSQLQNNSESKRLQEITSLPLFRIESMEVSSEEPQSRDTLTNDLQTQQEQNVPLIRKSMKLVEQPVVLKSMSNFNEPEIKDLQVYETGNDLKNNEPSEKDNNLIEFHAESQEQKENSPPVIRKRAYIPPESVLPGYPGFSDVKDLDKKCQSIWKPPKWDSAKRRKTEDKKVEKMKQKVCVVENKYGTRVKHTITPSSWREEQKLFRERLKALGKEENVINKLETIKGKGDKKKMEVNLVVFQDNNKDTQQKTTTSENLSKDEKTSDTIKKRSTVTSSFKIHKHTNVNAKRDSKLEAQSPPKVRHYDAEEARLFIEKQKFKRRQTAIEALNKKMQEQELKKQQLKELNEKAVKLAKASVKVKKCKINRIVKSNVLNTSETGHTESKDLKTTGTEKPSKESNVMPTKKVLKQGISSNEMVPEDNVNNLELSSSPPICIPDLHVPDIKLESPLFKIDSLTDAKLKKMTEILKQELEETSKLYKQKQSAKRLSSTLFTTPDKLKTAFQAEVQKLDSNIEKLTNINLLHSFQIFEKSGVGTSNLASSEDAALEPATSDLNFSHLLNSGNITTRNTPLQIPDLENISNLSTSIKEIQDSRRKISAVTKIQAIFRGYLQRKLNNEVVKKCSQKHEVFTDRDSRSELDISQGPLYEVTSVQVPQLPSLPDIELCHPSSFNFISAVKKKLQSLEIFEQPPTLFQQPGILDSHSDKKISAALTQESTNITLVDKREMEKSGNRSIDFTIQAHITTDSSPELHPKEVGLSVSSSVSPEIGSLLHRDGLSEEAPGMDLQHDGTTMFRHKLVSPKVALELRHNALNISTGSKTEHKISTSQDLSRENPKRRHPFRRSQRINFLQNVCNSQSEPQLVTQRTKTKLPVQPTSAPESTSSADDNSAKKHRIGQGMGDTSSYKQHTYADFTAGESLVFERSSTSTVLEPELLPSALGLQFQAELNLMDSIEQTQQQLLEVENIRALSLEKQDKTSLAQALTSVIIQHKQKMEEVERNAEKNNEFYREKQELKQFFEEALKNHTLNSRSNRIVSSVSSKLDSSKVEDKYNNRDALVSTDNQASSVTEEIESKLDSFQDRNIDDSQSVNASISEDIIDLNSSENMSGKAVPSDEALSDVGGISSMGITQKMQQYFPDVDLSTFKSSSELELDFPLNGSVTEQHESAELARLAHHMIIQLIKQEDEKVQNQKALLKAKDEVATERTKSQLAFLEIQKKTLREKGMEQGISTIRKKQRSLILKLQQHKEQLAKLKEKQKKHTKERKQMLLKHEHLLKMRMDSGPEGLKKRSESHSATSVSHSRQSSQSQVDKIGDQLSSGKIQSDIPEELEQSVVSSEAYTSVVTDTAMKYDVGKKKESVLLSEDVILECMDKLEKNKNVLNAQAKALLLRRQSLEAVIRQRKQLEAEEQQLQELENQVLNYTKTLKKSQDRNVQFRDSSTSPLQIPSIEEAITASTDGIKTTGLEQSSEALQSRVPMVDKSTSPSGILDPYENESFELVESSENSNPEMKSSFISGDGSFASKPEFPNQKRKKTPIITIKAPLSPLVTGKPRRRHSSGSDDSIIFSQNDTASEQSDAEGRVSALNEQLHKRMLEANRLRREQKRMRSERLKCKEQALLKQIQVYDNIIAKTKLDLEKEKEINLASSTTVVRPKIKQPRVAEKRRLDENNKAAPGVDDQKLDRLGTQIDVTQADQIRHLETQIDVTQAGQVKHLDDNLQQEIDTPSFVDSIVLKSSVIKELTLPSKSVDEDIPEELEVTDKSSNDASSIVSENIDDTASEDRHSLNQSFESGSVKSVSQGSSVETTIQSLLQLSKPDYKARDSDITSKIEERSNSLKEVDIATTKSSENENIRMKEQKFSIHDPEYKSSTEVSEEIEEELEYTSDFESSRDVKTSFPDVDHIPQDVETFRDVKTSFPGVDHIPQDVETFNVITKVDSEQVVNGNVSIVSEGPLEVSFEQENENTELLCEDISEHLPVEDVKDHTFIIEKEIHHKKNMILADEISNYIMVQLLKDLSFPHVKKHVEAKDEPSTEMKELEPIIIEALQDEEVIESEYEVGTDVTSGVIEGNNDVFPSEKQEEYLNKREEIIDTLFEESFQEALDYVLQINADTRLEKTKKMANKLQCTKSEANVEDSSVIRRVHEILAETVSSPSSVRERTRPQDLMVTTYDVLPPDEEAALVKSPVLPNDENYDKDHLDAPPTSPVEGKEDWRKVDFEVSLVAAADAESTDNEGFTQEWFDEDFGLSHTSREAEELRLQQMQIEQEIQQLQQAQEHIPYFYIREIPNKPPPPYTPPGHSPPRSRTRASLQREARTVPATRPEVTSFALTMSDMLYDIMMNGGNLDLVQPPVEIYSGDVEESRRIYKTFLFDLTKEIVMDTYEWETKEWRPLWEKPTCPNKRHKLLPRSKEMLREIVEKQVLNVFGFVQKPTKENMIMSWSRKKRDYVDDLLMREAHEEEEGWTNYDEDEVTLKNEIAISILNNILDDTVQTFQDIHKARLKKAL